MSEEIRMYYNPSCSKCLYALDFLKAQGITPKLIEYLSEAPSVQDLKSILNKLGLKPIDIVRTNEPLFIEKFSHRIYNDDEYLDLIVQYPVLMQRPILVKQDRAVIGRNNQSLEQII